MSYYDITEQQQKLYDHGVAARLKGLDKSSNPYLNNDLQVKHWWLAGWNDKDMELVK